MEKKNFNIQNTALLALADMDEIMPEAKDSVVPLMRIVKANGNPAPGTANCAVQVLGRIGPPAKDATPVILEFQWKRWFLKGRDNPAGVVLFGYIPKNVELSGQEFDYERTAIIALTHFGPDAVSMLVEKLELRHQHTPSELSPNIDEYGARYAFITTVLGRMGAGAKAAVPTLQKGLMDSEAAAKNREAHQVSCCAFALGDIGEPAKPAVPVLVSLLKSNVPSILKGATYALGEIRASDPETIEALIKTLKDPDMGLDAAKALAKIGRPAYPALEQALVEKDTPQAANALRFAGSDALPTLVKTFQKANDVNVRREIVKTIGEFGPEAKSMVPSLIGSLATTRGELLKETTLVLKAIAPDRILALLTAQLNKDDVESRLAAIEALGHLGRDAETVSPKLIDLLAHADANIRINASLALLQISPRGFNVRDAFKHLESGLMSEDNAVRRRAVSALIYVSATTTLHETGHLLLMATMIDDPQIREEVVLALGEIRIPRASRHDERDF